MADLYSFARGAPLPAQEWRSSRAFAISTPPAGAQKAPQPELQLLGGGRAIIDNQYRVAKMADLEEAGTPSVDEGKLLQDIVRERVRMPQYVRRVEFRFGEDSTGAPAVWIIFVAHDDLKPSKSKIASLQRAAEEVRSIVLSETSRWPYIEIATE